MTGRQPSVVDMSTARRMQMVGVLALVAAGLGLAGVGSLLAAVGVSMPEGVGRTLASAESALGWLRLGVFLPLLYAVVRARED